jgi:hypothetical protein
MRVQTTAGFVIAAACALAGIFVVAPAAGQTPPPSPDCEIHAWPGSDFHTTYYGWTHGGTTDASLVRRKGYPPIQVDTLPASRQARILGAADLAGALGLSGYRTTVHPQPLAGKAVRATVGRHEPQSADCYAELLVEGITLQADFATGKHLNVIYRLRRFRTGEAPAFTFGSFVTAPMSVPLTGKDTAAPEQLSASAEAAFAQTIVLFGAAARKAAARAETASANTRGKQ